jgi:hypothetical protein
MSHGTPANNGGCVGLGGAEPDFAESTAACQRRARS